MPLGTASKFLVGTVCFFSILCLNWTVPTYTDHLNTFKTNGSKRSKLTPSATISRHNRENEKLYYFPLNTLRILRTRVISPSNIYAFSENSILHFNGLKWDVIYSLSHSSFIGADCDGRYLVFSVDSFDVKSMTRPYIFISTITNINGVVRLSHPAILKTGISDPPNIIFIKPGSAVLGGIMQIGLINVKHKTRRAKFSYDFKLYPTNAVTYWGTVYFSESTKGGNFFAWTSRYVSELKDYRGELRLRRIIDLANFCNESSKSNASLDDELFLSFSDSSFGVIKSCNNLLVYFKTERESSVRVIVNPPFDLKLVSSICAVSPEEFWVVTSDGVLMRAKRSGEKLTEWNWQKIGVIPDVSQRYFLTRIDSDRILVAGSSIIIFRREITPEEWQEGLTKGENASLFSTFMFSPATNYGVGIRDFNNDGTEDVAFASITGANQLYLLKCPAGQTINLDHYLALRGLSPTHSGSNSLDYSENVAITCGDINEDGSEDVIISSVSGHNQVFLNNGSGYFKNVTERYGLSSNSRRSEGVVLADVNNDGYLDLFETSFNGSNKLLLNEHGDFFKDVTAVSGLSSEGSSITAAFSDVDGDGYPDLYVGNWGNLNKMYRNNGDGTFTDVTDISGTGCGIGKHTNSVLFADFNNDGRPDLFVGNKGGGNRLFINEGGFHFKDVSRESGLEDTMYTYGAVYGDFNNDGLLDLLVVGLGEIKIYQNLKIDTLGIPHFQNITSQCTIPKEYINGYNTGAATFDLSKDGALSVVVAQFNGRSFLLRNNFTDIYRNNRRFIEVRVEGSRSNRDGIGTKLFLFHDGKLAAFREVCSSYGYASSSSEIQHFGLLDPEGKYELKVVFPSSHVVRTMAVLPGSIVRVREYTGIKESYYLAKKEIFVWLFGGNLEESVRDFLIYIGVLALIGFFIKSPAGSTYLKSAFKSGEVSLRVSTIIGVPVVTYILASIFLRWVVFTSNSMWMSVKNSHLMVDSISLLVGIVSQVVIISLDHRHFYRKTISKEVISKLYTGLKAFEHGEGSGMVLERLSLFCKNMPVLIDSRAKDSAEDVNISTNVEYAFERFRAALREWKEQVHPELENIVELYRTIDGKNQTDKFNGLADEINSYTKFISRYVDRLEKLFASNVNLEQNNSLRRYLSSMDDGVLRLRKVLEKSLEVLSNVFICDVNKIARNVVNRYQDIAFSGINIVLNLSYGAVFAIADYVELFNVLETLVENAIQAFSNMPDSEREHLIKISVFEADSLVKIFVEDNGPGLSDEQMNFAFKRNISTKAGGHGFGLIYAREVIERYGGRIYVDKEYLKGARFVIDLRKVIK